MAAVSPYLSEPITVDGIVQTTRGALLSEWRTAGVPEDRIARWFQGYDYEPQHCDDPDCYPCAFGATTRCQRRVS